MFEPKFKWTYPHRVLHNYGLVWFASKHQKKIMLTRSKQQSVLFIPRKGAKADSQDTLRWQGQSIDARYRPCFLDSSMRQELRIVSLDSSLDIRSRNSSKSFGPAYMCRMTLVSTVYTCGILLAITVTTHGVKIEIPQLIDMFVIYVL